MFPSKTDSDGLIILVYFILNSYPHNITIAHSLQIVIKEIILSRALGLCSAQGATLRNLDFRLKWSVVVKCCHAIFGHP